MQGERFDSASPSPSGLPVGSLSPLRSGSRRQGLLICVGCARRPKLSSYHSSILHRGRFLFTLGASAHPSANGGELTQNVNQGLASVSLHARFNSPLELAGEGFLVR